MRFVIILFAVFLVLYWIFVYFLVSAALVPSFMRKLEAFETITEQSYARQIQTDDIKENEKQMQSDTQLWLETVEMEKVSIESSDGYKLVAAEFCRECSGSDWVVLLHGYTGWKEAMYPFAYWYYEKGYNVLVPDLRCQGESEGDFIGMGLTDSADCLLWLDYILEKDKGARIVLHGQSMGAAAALMLTGFDELPDNVIAVISDCAYTDARSMFGDKCKDWFHLPAFPLVDSAIVMLRLRGGYDLRDASALKAVSVSTTPTLFIHGVEDAMIDAGMAEELYEAAACKKELLLVDGAGHAQSQDKEPELYYGTIERFISEAS